MANNILCYFCSNKAIKQVQDGLGLVDVCKTCLHKMNYGMGINGINMAYKRRSNWLNYDSNKNTVKVSIVWDNLTNAGYIFSMKPFIKLKCEPIIVWIKASVPTSQREYDPTTFSWFIGESYGLQLKSLIETMGSNYELNFVEKPDFTPTAKFYNKEDDKTRLLQIFEIAGVAKASDFGDQEFTDSGSFKKAFRQAAMKLHPDHAVNSHNTLLMAEMNEVYSRLKRHKFTSVEV